LIGNQNAVITVLLIERFQAQAERRRKDVNLDGHFRFQSGGIFMIRAGKRVMTGSAIVVFFGIFLVSSAEESIDWKKDFDNEGNIVKMTLTNPKTTLGIEKEMVFNVDLSGNPSGNILRFTNGFERPMSPDEVRIYWEKFHGAREVWNTWQSKGRLNTMASGVIPKNWFGNETRLITSGNVEIIGKLESSATPGEYVLEVGRACCGPSHFTFGGVSQLQQLK
jgi:hypothetical protein